MFLHPRQCLYFVMSGVRREIPGADEIDSHERGEESQQGNVLDENDEICAIRGDTIDAGEVSTSSSTNSKRKKRHHRTQPNGQETTVQTILQFFKTFPVCPLLSSCKTIQWLENSKLQHIGRTDSDFQLAIDIFQREICNKTINELIEFYLNCTPLFGCTSGHIFDYYYSIEESTDKLDSVLKFQYDYNVENIYIISY